MIEKAIYLWFLFFFVYGFFFLFYSFLFYFIFVCFGKILSQLEAASSVLPRIETFARCPRVVPSAAPRGTTLGQRAQVSMLGRTSDAASNINIDKERTE